MQIQTRNGYALLDVSSALQKAIRRADGRLAGYWAMEIFESRFEQYLWRRLLTISAEDCWGVITHEIESLYRCYEVCKKNKPGSGRIFAAKAALLLAAARKSRDADHLTNLVYDQKNVDENQLLSDIDESRKYPEKIPEYAFDCHTSHGKRSGKTKKDFFRDEFLALKPREKGLFDDLPL